jgi:hypothetical protein
LLRGSDRMQIANGALHIQVCTTFIASTSVRVRKSPVLADQVKDSGVYARILIPVVRLDKNQIVGY